MVYKNEFFEGFYSVQKMRRHGHDSSEWHNNTPEELEAAYNEMFMTNVIFSALLCIFGTYFLGNEAIQFSGSKLEYF